MNIHGGHTHKKFADEKYKTKNLEADINDCQVHPNSKCCLNM